MVIKVSNTNQPNWTEVKVNANLPKNLHKLQEIAYNLWWVWNSEAKNIFRYIDNDAWQSVPSIPLLYPRKTPSAPQFPLPSAPRHFPEAEPS